MTAQSRAWPALTDEALAELELRLHEKSAHPFYEYRSTTTARGQTGEMPPGKYWEPHPCLVARTHAFMQTDRWYRSVFGEKPLRYSHSELETIQKAAIAHEAHPHFEFERREVSLADHPIGPSEEIRVQYLLDHYVFAYQETDWKLNAFHVTGGFSVSAYNAQFWFYRQRK